MLILAVLFTIIGLFVMVRTIKRHNYNKNVTAFGMTEKEVAQLDLFINSMMGE